MSRFPTRITVDGTADVTSPASNGGAADEDDFFSSWQKPATPKPATPAAAPTPPPVLGRAPSASRTVSSSSLLSSSSTAGSRPASKLGASRLNSSSNTMTSTTPSSALKKSKLGGLGAKKAAAPLDFAEAERKAAEEAERIRQLGYDREKEAEEERARKEAEESAKSSIKLTSTTAKSAPVVPTPNQPKGNPQDLERLGMGMKRLGFGAVPAPAATTSKARYGTERILSFRDHSVSVRTSVD